MHRDSNRRIVLMVVVAASLAAGSFSALSAALALDPQKACMALADAGLPARGGYNGKPGEGFRCDSQRKTIMAGDEAQDEIHFSALGDQQAVQELRLVLNVRSGGDIQRAHHKLAEYAGKLTKSMLQTSLPKEVNDAILSALNGSWTSGSYVFELRRTTVGFGLYQLRLVIR